jgi:hypothetical protein
VKKLALPGDKLSIRCEPEHLTVDKNRLASPLVGKNDSSGKLMSNISVYS